MAAPTIKHAFTSAKSDGPDSTLVKPSDWNASHTLTPPAGTSLQLLRVNAGETAYEHVASSGASAATQAQMEAGSDATVFVSPARHQFHPSSLKAWGNWNNAGTLAISYNITSITDTAIGDHTVNLTTAMSGTTSSSHVTGDDAQPVVGHTSTMGTSTLRVTGRNTASQALADMDVWNFHTAGDQP